MSTEPPTSPIDLSHHLSELAKARQPSAIKTLMPYVGVPGMISLGGGLPSATLFPFDSISSASPTPDRFPLSTHAQPSSLSSWSWFWSLFGSGSKRPKDQIEFTVPKFGANPSSIALSTALQYSSATGLPTLASFVHEFSRIMYAPAYPGFETLLSTGCTDAWSKIVLTFCERGETILCEEFAYPSALAATAPYDIKTMPIALDEQGMRADVLEDVLANWDKKARGSERPHVAYLVPVGQNPTGQTMGADRKRELYEIFCRYDVLIFEDDPYYQLQLGDWRGADLRGETATLSEHIASLAPSFLKFDREGRVIRMDTFSKTIAPGSRLGWFTCNAVFAERLLRCGEVSTQAPCGFAQALITELIANRWRLDGFSRWLQGLRVQYKARRDVTCDCFDAEFDLRREKGAGIVAGSTGYVCYPKQAGKGEKRRRHVPMASFVPPTSGMFVWLRVHFEEHPDYARLMLNHFNAQGGVPEEVLTERLFRRLAENLVLVCPGTFFVPGHSTGEPAKHVGHYRISFSTATEAELRTAIATLRRVLEAEFQV